MHDGHRGGKLRADARQGGRAASSNLSWPEKCPILLPTDRILRGNRAELSGIRTQTLQTRSPHRKRRIGQPPYGSPDEANAVSGFQRLLAKERGGSRLTNEIAAKNYEIFIGRKEYNFALWMHSYAL
jgi:hypothetical protein